MYKLPLYNKKETGGNNNQSTHSFRMPVILNPFFDAEIAIFISKMGFWRVVLPDTDSLVSHIILKIYSRGQEKKC